MTDSQEKAEEQAQRGPNWLLFIIPVTLFVVLVAFFVRGLSLNPRYVPSPLIGKPAPAFSLPALSDPETILTERLLSGQPTLLNVWATWCSGCREEHDFLLQLARTAGVPIYGLNWKDDAEAARSWLKQLGNPYQAVAFDGEGRVAIDWGVYGAPETFLIGADGKVLYKHLAPLTAEVWEREFVPLLSEARGGAR
ncbi:MAG: DsbE family thiol:disulfide interchange protein [Gammaproteobacteria bacterium]|nr:DsbE family thiol:disulfide interchange protein [Gammaproteobacteria bacterium]